MQIDRNNPVHAQNVVDRLISDLSLRQLVLSFLSEAVVLAKKTREHNWNINLDKNGWFVRFNVGRVYCIELEKKGLLVIGKREFLPQEVTGKQFDIQFRGYVNQQVVMANDCEMVPDVLASVPDSVGCFMAYEQQILQVLPLLKDANHHFLVEAIMTTNLRPIMRRAHSPGFEAFLLQNGTEEGFYQNERERVQRVSHLSEKDY